MCNIIATNTTIVNPVCDTLVAAPKAIPSAENKNNQVHSLTIPRIYNTITHIPPLARIVQFDLERLFFVIGGDNNTVADERLD